jgi:putative toxin-antitoxin system antitoxin component (TIGR02293 family)
METKVPALSRKTKSDTPTVFSAPKQPSGREKSVYSSAKVKWFEEQWLKRGHKGFIVAEDPNEKPMMFTVELMGGKKTIGQNPESPAAAHDMLMKGLPSKALDQLLGRLQSISTADALELGMGISQRTHQRAKSTPTRILSPALSGRTWVFASIIGQAVSVFGTQKAAEEWLQHPSLALDQRTPLSLLSTPEGLGMVKTVLGRLEHGVYT